MGKKARIRFSPPVIPFATALSDTGMVRGGTLPFVEAMYATTLYDVTLTVARFPSADGTTTTYVTTANDVSFLLGQNFSITTLDFVTTLNDVSFNVNVSPQMSADPALFITTLNDVTMSVDVAVNAYQLDVDTVDFVTSIPANTMTVESVHQAFIGVRH